MATSLLPCRCSRIISSEHQWGVLREVSIQTLGAAWFAAKQQSIAEQGPPPLGFHLLLGPIFAEMGKNMARNLAENRVALAEILCRKR